MKLLIRMFLIVLVIFSCIGCSKDKESTAKDKVGYTVVDARGKKISFTKPPERITSLHYATDEILLDLIDNKRIVAVSKSAKNPDVCNNLEKANKIPLIAEPNVEFMLANKIDCLIIRENFDKNFIAQAEQAGIKVVVVANPKDVDGIKVLLRKMAEIVHAKEQGELLVQGMEKNLNEVIAKIGKIPAEKQKSAMVVSALGASSLRGTILDEVFKYAQVKNATDKLEASLPSGTKIKLSKEQIVACNPDCLLIISVTRAKNMNGSSVVEEYKNDPSLSTIKAVKTDQLTRIPMRYTICFSHYIGNNVLELSKAVYKEKLGGM